MDEPTEPEKVEESPIIKIKQEKMDKTESPVKATTESPAKAKESPAKAKESPAKAKLESPAKTKLESPAKTKLESPAKTKLESPAKAKTDSPAKMAKQKGFGHVQEGAVKVKMEPSDDAPRVKVEPTEKKEAEKDPVKIKKVCLCEYYLLFEEMFDINV